jgi:hypothetical protein
MMLYILVFFLFVGNFISAIDVCVDVIELPIRVELCIIEDCEVIIDSSNVVDPCVETVFSEKNYYFNIIFY